MSKIIFGIDVGGTTCKCGTFSEEGELLRKEEIPTRKDEGGSLILPDISEYIKGVLADMNMTTEDVAGIGMGLPGACLEDGTVNKCINLGWGVFNAANALSELTGIPVKIGNDANMAALGEFWVGGGSVTPVHKAQHLRSILVRGRMAGMGVLVCAEQSGCIVGHHAGLHIPGQKFPGVLLVTGGH